MKELTAFIDESGNSGVKIFNGTDKFHWVGVMLSANDVEAMKDRIQRLVQTVEFNELHGGELGLTRIDKISEGLISIYEELDVNFIFTRVEREHVATMKFVDLVFDSENNKAVPNWLYNVKFNRLLTAYAIAKTLTTEHRKRFWTALGSLNKGISQFQSLMNDIKEHFITNSEYIPDLCLFIEIFDYAASHAELILELDVINKERSRIREEGKREETDDVFVNLEKYRSANLATFNITIGAIHGYLQGKNSRITQVVHDEQDEFYKQLNIAFENNSKIMDSSEFYSYPRIQLAESFSGKLDFVNSSNSAGVQLIDLATWLMKQVYVSGKELTGGCDSLFKTIVNRSVFDGFSLKQLELMLSEMNERL